MKTFDDKTLHVIICMLICFIAAENSLLVFNTRYWASLGIGLLVGLLAAVIKELVIDKWLKKGAATWADLLAGVYGSFAGTVLAAMVLGFALRN